MGSFIKQLLLLYFFILFIRCLGVYHVTERLIPTYLNHSFQNLSDKIFPNDISMNVSLSRLSGTLLYSIDSKGNQLIISLSDVNTPTLDIEFHNKEHIYVSLPKLCGCILCKYEPILLRIQMRDTIILQCNNGDRESFKYDRTQHFNSDYPIPIFAKTDKLDAHLWLVNTPHVGNIYPNNAQLSGCIFDVWYKRERLKMGTYRTEDKCIPTCDSTICNTGTCLETYNTYPICNCTDSFNNGKFCSDGVITRNLIIKQPLLFKAIKLSWSRTPDSIVFQLTNGHTSVQLVTFNNTLTFVLNCTDGVNIKIEGVVSDKYRSEENNILVIVFNEKTVDLKFRSNSIPGTVIQIPHNHDLSRKIFSKLTLCSGSGIIDMAYLNDMKEIIWNTLDYSRNVHTIARSTSHTVTSTFPSVVTSAAVLDTTAGYSMEVTKKDEDKNNATEMIIENLNKKVDLALNLLITCICISVLSLVVIVLYIAVRISKRHKSKDKAETALSRHGKEETSLLDTVNMKEETSLLDTVNMYPDNNYL